MIREARIFITCVGIALATIATAQTKVDEQRMQRDIEVAENILTTLIKQEFSRRNFFPVEITGEYREGHGVTFRLPEQFNGDMMRMFMNDSFDAPNIIMNNGPGGSFSYSISSDAPEAECADCPKASRNWRHRARPYYRAQYPARAWW